MKTKKLFEYKKTLKKFNITHKDVAMYTGHTRETITKWLNAWEVPPINKQVHIAQEIQEMIDKHKLVK